jgi:hypothetical protein
VTQVMSSSARASASDDGDRDAEVTRPLRGAIGVATDQRPDLDARRAQRRDVDAGPEGRPDHGRRQGFAHVDLSFSARR